LERKISVNSIPKCKKNVTLNFKILTPQSYSKTPYFLAAITGIGLQFFYPIPYFPTPQILLAFLIGGFFGYKWPKLSWRWGLWIMGPILGLVCFSVLFAGNLEIFMTEDLPHLAISLLGTSLGGLVFSRWKINHKKA
jgi:hypothetical protein